MIIVIIIRYFILVVVVVAVVVGGVILILGVGPFYMLNKLYYLYIYIDIYGWICILIEIL
jgi:hypothetical protein